MSVARRRRWVQRVGAGAVAVLLLAAGARELATQDEAPAPPPVVAQIPVEPALPWIGTNYTHVAYRDCSMDGGGVLHDRSGAARTAVVQQLTEMRRRGVQTLRLLVWHMHDASRHDWGIVSSAGGRLSERAGDNLLHYLRTADQLGYSRVTLAFGPEWTNSPLSSNYDARLLEENWAFIRDVRQLAVAQAPRLVRFDLLNEGAASDHLPTGQQAAMRSYVGEMYDRYVQAFGADDVTVSTIAAEHVGDDGNRLANLLDVLVATGRPLPAWFDVHLNLGPAQARHGLEDAVRVLAERGLRQPLVIGEAPYNDRDVAEALAASPALARVDEVVQWVGRPDEACNASPPFAVDGYAAVLRGATVGRRRHRRPHRPATATTSRGCTAARSLRS